MTTYFPFQPSNQAAPSFQPTLDGNPYRCTVTWNLFGQRYYLNCYDSANVPVFCVAVVESLPSIPIEVLEWSDLTLEVAATTDDPHGFAIGALVRLTIAGASPDSYDGAFDCSITGPNTFTYPMADDPGQVVSPGSASFLISLCAGYFSSTIVFRNKQFEVSP